MGLEPGAVVQLLRVGEQIVEFGFDIVVAGGIVPAMLVRRGHGVFPALAAERPPQMRLAELDEDLVGPVDCFPSNKRQDRAPAHPLGHSDAGGLKQGRR